MHNPEARCIFPVGQFPKIFYGDIFSCPVRLALQLNDKSFPTSHKNINNFADVVELTCFHLAAAFVASIVRIFT